MIEVIKKAGEENVVQVITDSAVACKGARMIIETSFPKVFGHVCCSYINSCIKEHSDPQKTERNELVYEECCWITQVVDQVGYVMNFIMSHTMRLAMFNHFSSLKLLVVAETCFASIIVMLRRCKILKHSLQSMILLNLYIVRLELVIQTAPHFIWSMRCEDTMIEKVRHERKDENSDSLSFYDVIYLILIARWAKSCTPLHYMTHSLNPRYYSDEWTQEAPNRHAPHEDEEISMERNKCLKKLFRNDDDRKQVSLEYANFSSKSGSFDSFYLIEDMWRLDPKSWWVLLHGSSALLLQKLVLKLLVQPCSSSCCERNWSTYSLIHSMKRNKLKPKRAKDLVYVHTNLRLLSRKIEEYKQEDTKMWDIAGDAWEDFDSAGTLKVTTLSLDEPKVEVVLFANDGQGGDEIDTISISRARQ
ncbi:hypothetical protein Lal_00018448 [Lupinus albus]|nr:hypothetical protein Lal_00018448 [Lupinus albus]